MVDDLADRIAALAEDARAAAVEPHDVASLARVIDRLEGPLRLAISGKVNAGKSTLLNALIGERLAPTDARESTQIITWYRFSIRPYAKIFTADGRDQETSYTRGEDSLDVHLGGLDVQAIDHLEIGWPTTRLTDLILIDTPGIASISTEVSARTHRALSAESGHVPVADGVLYLLRHAHNSDLRFLEAFHDDKMAEGTPVNAVGVLSRADEIGCGRLNAMAVAERVATRYLSDSRLHRLCPVVVPVTGLLGHGAVTLHQHEYASLAAVARAPRDEIGDLLLTADRFAMAESGRVSTEDRTKLLDRLGLFGVRLSVELLRSGAVTSSPELCARLADASGLDRLRRVVLRQFAERARVLKARSAAAALREILLRGHASDGQVLLERLEQITAGAHDFEELRVLLELRGGGLSLTTDRAAQLELLMGGAGHEPAARLGLPENASAEEVRLAALDALALWQGVEQHPLSSRATQIAARAAARTVEGFLAG